MLMGHTNGLSELGSKDHLLEQEKELDGDDSDNDVVTPEEILYAASFEELAINNIKYDTIIWVSISLLLVLAWRVGIIMLLYLPVRRYVLKKDISSQKLYVTPDEIVYKVNVQLCYFCVCPLCYFLWDIVIIILLCSREGFEAFIRSLFG